MSKVSNIPRRMMKLCTYQRRIFINDHTFMYRGLQCQTLHSGISTNVKICEMLNRDEKVNVSKFVKIRESYIIPRLLSAKGFKKSIRFPRRDWLPLFRHESVCAQLFILEEF